MVDQAGDRRRAESVVDVHDRDARCATVQHAEQGGQSAEAGSVSNRCRDGNDRDCDETLHHAWQCALHSSHHDDDVSIGEAFSLVQQSMQSCHADVV